MTKSVAESKLVFPALSVLSVKAMLEEIGFYYTNWRELLSRWRSRSN